MKHARIAWAGAVHEAVESNGELLLTRRWTGPKHEKQGVTARPQVAAN